MKLNFGLACVLLPALAGCSAFDSPLIKACEDGVKLRLRSPATYNRVEVVEVARPQPMSADEYVAFQAKYYPASSNAAVDGLAPSPAVHEAFIKYDADNAFGTPIRGVANCKFATEDGKMPVSSISDMMIVINDQTYFEWAADE